MGNDMEFEGERPPMNVLPHPSGIRVRLTKLRKCSYKTSSQSGTKLDFDLQSPRVVMLISELLPPLFLISLTRSILSSCLESPDPPCPENMLENLSMLQCRSVLRGNRTSFCFESRLRYLETEVSWRKEKID